MVTDPTGDLLIQIKNGYLAKKESITVPHSFLKERIARVLAKEGYIGAVAVHGTASRGSKRSKTAANQTIGIELKYTDGTPALANVKRISKPGVRIYVDRHHIPTVMTGYGMAILSTSQGIVTDREARKLKVGGEVLCHIW